MMYDDDDITRQDVYEETRSGFSRLFKTLFTIFFFISLLSGILTIIYMNPPEERSKAKILSDFAKAVGSETERATDDFWENVAKDLKGFVVELIN